MLFKHKQNIYNQKVSTGRPNKNLWIYIMNILPSAYIAAIAKTAKMSKSFLQDMVNE